VSRASPRPRLQARAWRQPPLCHLLLEVLQAVHQPHVGADPPALSLGRIIRVVDAEFGVLEEAVGDNQASRPAGALLAVNKHFLPFLGTLVDGFAKVQKVRRDIGIVVPRHMDVLGLLERLRLRRRRGVVLWEIFICRGEAGGRCCSLGDRRVFGGCILGLRRCRGRLEGVDDFASHIDDHVEAGRLICSRLEVEVNLVAVDGNRAIWVTR
jgi:hypothetical protein